MLRGLRREDETVHDTAHDRLRRLGRHQLQIRRRGYSPCVYVCVYVCMYVCMYVYNYMRMKFILVIPFMISISLTKRKQRKCNKTFFNLLDVSCFPLPRCISSCKNTYSLLSPRSNNPKVQFQPIISQLIHPSFL